MPLYFTQQTEESLAKYLATDDITTRNKIWDNELHVPFTKLVECIYNRFKFQYVGDSRTAQDDCLSFVFLQLHKFRPNTGFKAFSYFSLVARNYFIYNNNNSYKNNLRQTEIRTEINEENMTQIEPELQHYDKPDFDRNEFIYLVTNWFEQNLDTYFTKKQIKNFVKEFIKILRHPDSLSNVDNSRAIISIKGNFAKLLASYASARSQCRTTVYLYYKDLLNNYLNTGIVKLTNPDLIYKYGYNGDNECRSTTTTIQDKQNKKCIKCKEILPISYFHMSKIAKDKLRSYCKICCSVINAEYRNKHKKITKTKYNQYPNTDTDKHCSKCDKYQPFDNFGLDNRQKDKLMAWCKDCIKCQNAEYKKNNAAYFNDWTDNNKNKLAAYRVRQKQNKIINQNNNFNFEKTA